MPVYADIQRARFTLSGADLAPPSVFAASDRDRAAFWTQVAVLARDRKYAELHRGVGVDGAKLKPRERVRRDRANGPVLVPHFSDSRFRTMLRWAGTRDGAVVFWKAPWAKIVRYHAEGVRYPNGRVIVRNVVGLTRQSVEWVRRRAAAWWEARVAAGRMGDRAFTVQGGLALDARGGDGAVAGGWGKAPPRPTGSIFAPPPESFRPVRPTRLAYRPADVPELHRLVEDWMAAAGRAAVTRASIADFVRTLDLTQTTDALRSVLYRLGVPDPPGDRTEVLRLVRLQITERLRTGRRPPLAPLPPDAGARPRLFARRRRRLSGVALIVAAIAAATAAALGLAAAAED